MTITIVIQTSTYRAINCTGRQVTDHDLCGLCEHGLDGRCFLGWPGREDQDGHVRLCPLFSTRKS